MKYLIVSDIHGSIESTNIILQKFVEEKCDKIICLGDILYHGPRNDLPANYEPKAVIKALNPYADKIIAIKGNCDAEVDEMVLDFPLYKAIDDTFNCFQTHLEHGHHLDTFTGKPMLCLYGHTHICTYLVENDVVFMNPGSITIPKAGTPRSYAIWEDNTITCLSMTGETIFQYTF